MVTLAAIVPGGHGVYDLSIDVDTQAVPPQWPPLAQRLVVKDGVYELTDVPMTSIVLVTSRTLKVTTVLT
jgi:hypothetical protein